MDTAGEGSSKKGKRRKDTGKAPARRRPARPRKPTSATRLIQQLRQIVFPSPNTKASRRQVLHQTRTYIQELENTLDSLLKMRGHFKVLDSGSSSLEDVKEEYMQMHFVQEQGGILPNTAVASDSEPMYWHLQSDLEVGLGEAVEELIIDSQIPEPPSSPDLIEFERYLYFYRQTMDMLTESHVVSPEQIAEPVVSKAIANLWQDLKREGDASICHYGVPQAQSTPCFFTLPSDSGCTDGCAKDNSTGSQEASSSFLSSTPEEAQSTPCFFTLPSDSGCTDGCAKDNSTGSQEASSSFLSSTPEEILFEDAFDVAAGFLDPGAFHSTSSPRYTTSAPQFDYETVLLRCTETFDDEEDL
ncbi:PREDICTED: stimulated by retinoic acid gene 8 protein homolog [Nanorana parkeri]|uniref:stimulated by retinoic acid gene 8 protein homolog n=1 Tax=Nanorana parkeri TaxID=125878 RepID=UPI0008540828|nr:PREDICTED: stimulated by retinoic acid gene 8 protein homolog [Nanorana parkeri]